MYKKVLAGRKSYVGDINAVAMHKAIDSIQSAYSSGKISVCKDCSAITEMK